MKVEKKILKNKTRLILVEMPESPTVTMEVLVETGSNYEQKNNSGISHFLEHMCFKGTLKRRSSQIAFELDSLGAESNAFTGNEYTGYYAKAHYSKLENLFEIVSDLYLNPIFPKEELEKERGVIIEELNMYEDLPSEKAHEIFNQLLYPESPAGRPIIGSKENILSLKREEFLEYRFNQYTPQKTIVIVSGKFNSDQVTKLFEQNFSDLPKRETVERDENKINQTKNKISIFDKPTDQVHLKMGLYGPNIFSEDRWALSLLSVVLGNGMSSRLFKKMREELGICYYIYSSNILGLDYGHLMVSAGVSSSRVAEAVSSIFNELRKIATQEIDENELNKAKEFKIGNMAMSLESSDELADFFGFEELYFKEILKPEEKFKKIKSVSPAEVLKVAQKYLIGKQPFLAMVGKQNHLTNLDNLLEDL